MAIEDDSIKILEYLKKHGQTNTFKLASELSIDRYIILNIVKRLEEKQAVEVISGVVRFLKFPRKEKKAIKKLEAKKAPSKQKKEIKHKKTALEIVQAENIRLKEKLSELQNAPPKIIRRTKVEKIIQRVPVKSRKLGEQAEHIKELEERVKELQRKASAHPKTITRTVTKTVIRKIRSPPKIITKTIIKRAPVTKTVIRKIPVIRTVVKKIHVPHSLLSQKKEKIKRGFKLPKIDFSGLHKNIKKLNVPETLRNP